MWWTKKQIPSKVLIEMTEVMIMVEKRISSLEIAVDGLLIRMRKKMFPKGELEEETKPGIDDGFEELRKLNKLKKT